eukprot:1143341-Pelagomonas_calceolata.AAC.4
MFNGWSGGHTVGTKECSLGMSQRVQGMFNGWSGAHTVGTKECSLGMSQRVQGDVQWACHVSLAR